MEKKEKDSYIRIRCTSEFKKQVEQLATQRGLSLSGYITFMLTEKIEEELK